MEEAFDPSFLERLREMDDPSTAGEGELSGPWKIVELEAGYGLFRAWESPETGHQPYVQVFDETLLLLAHGAEYLGRSPLALAGLLRAAGPLVMRQVGEIVYQEYFPKGLEEQEK